MFEQLVVKEHEWLYKQLLLSDDYLLEIPFQRMPRFIKNEITKFLHVHMNLPEDLILLVYDF